jgi:sugar phosphate isomerase/epimerase
MTHLTISGRFLAWIALCFVAAAASAADQNTGEPKIANPFYAFQDGLTGVPPKDQPKLLKELGYDGIEFEGTPQQVPEMLEALDAQGLKMFCMYVGANVEPNKPPYNPGLKTAIEQLKGRGTIITLLVLGGKPSSADSDDRAVAVVREIASLAEASGLRVALYPHFGCYVARVEDAIRLIEKVDRKNVGVSFNLCHFLKLDDEKNLERRLKEASPHLFVVSINGADGGDTNRLDWNRLIQTLDRGNFDVSRVLKTLKRLNYAGPIGLQCYAIPGDPRENLKRSMKAWRSLNAR